MHRSAVHLCHSILSVVLHRKASPALRGAQISALGEAHFGGATQRMVLCCLPKPTTMTRPKRLLPRAAFTLQTKLMSKKVLQKPLSCMECLTEPHIKWFGSALSVPQTCCLQKSQKHIGQLQGPLSRMRCSVRPREGSRGDSILLAPV